MELVRSAEKQVPRGCDRSVMDREVISGKMDKTVAQLAECVEMTKRARIHRMEPFEPFSGPSSIVDNQFFRGPQVEKLHL